MAEALPFSSQTVYEGQGTVDLKAFIESMTLDQRVQASQKIRNILLKGFRYSSVTAKNILEQWRDCAERGRVGWVPSEDQIIAFLKSPLNSFKEFPELFWHLKFVILSGSPLTSQQIFGKILGEFYDQHVHVVIPRRVQQHLTRGSEAQRDIITSWPKISMRSAADRVTAPDIALPASEAGIKSQDPITIHVEQFYKDFYRKQINLWSGFYEGSPEKPPAPKLVFGREVGELYHRHTAAISQRAVRAVLNDEDLKQDWQEIAHYIRALWEYRFGKNAPMAKARQTWLDLYGPSGDWVPNLDDVRLFSLDPLAAIDKSPEFFLTLPYIFKRDTRQASPKDFYGRIIDEVLTSIIALQNAPIIVQEGLRTVESSPSFVSVQGRPSPHKATARPRRRLAKLLGSEPIFGDIPDLLRGLKTELSTGGDLLRSTFIEALAKHRYPHGDDIETKKILASQSIRSILASDVLTEDGKVKKWAVILAEVAGLLKDAGNTPEKIYDCYLQKYKARISSYSGEYVAARIAHPKKGSSVYERPLFTIIPELGRRLAKKHPPHPPLTQARLARAIYDCRHSFRPVMGERIPPSRKALEFGLSKLLQGKCVTLKGEPTITAVALALYLDLDPLQIYGSIGKASDVGPQIPTQVVSLSHQLTSEKGRSLHAGSVVSGQTLADDGRRQQSPVGQEEPMMRPVGASAELLPAHATPSRGIPRDTVEMPPFSEARAAAILQVLDDKNYSKAWNRARELVKSFIYEKFGNKGAYRANIIRQAWQGHYVAPDGWLPTEEDLSPLPLWLHEALQKCPRLYDTLPVIMGYDRPSELYGAIDNEVLRLSLALGARTNEPDILQSTPSTVEACSPIEEKILSAPEVVVPIITQEFKGAAQIVSEHVEEVSEGHDSSASEGVTTSALRSADQESGKLSQLPPPETLVLSPLPTSDVKVSEPVRADSTLAELTKKVNQQPIKTPRGLGEEQLFQDVPEALTAMNRELSPSGERVTLTVLITAMAKEQGLGYLDYASVHVLLSGDVLTKKSTIENMIFRRVAEAFAAVVKRKPEDIFSYYIQKRREYLIAHPFKQSSAVLTKPARSRAEPRSYKNAIAETTDPVYILPPAEKWGKGTAITTAIIDAMNKLICNMTAEEKREVDCSIRKVLDEYFSSASVSDIHKALTARSLDSGYNWMPKGRQVQDLVASPLRALQIYPVMLQELVRTLRVLPRRLYGEKLGIFCERLLNGEKGTDVVLATPSQRAGLQTSSAAPR